MSRRGNGTQQRNKGFSQKQFQQIIKHGFHGRPNFSSESADTGKKIHQPNATTLFSSRVVTFPTAIRSNAIDRQTKSFVAADASFPPIPDSPPVSDNSFHKGLNVPTPTNPSLPPVQQSSSSIDVIPQQQSSTSSSEQSVVVVVPTTFHQTSTTPSASVVVVVVNDQSSEVTAAEQIDESSKTISEGSAVTHDLSEPLLPSSKKTLFEGNDLYPKFEFAPFSVSSWNDKIQQLVNVKNDITAQFRAQDSSYFVPANRSGQQQPIFAEGYRAAPARNMVMNWQFIPVELRPDKLRKEAIRKMQSANAKNDKRNKKNAIISSTNAKTILERLEKKEKDEENRAKNEPKQEDQKKAENDGELDDVEMQEDDDFGDELVFERYDDDEDNYDMGDDGTDDGPVF